MNKKIITILSASIVTLSLFTSVAFASEVTGSLSSGGVVSENQTNGQNTTGTLSGSVVGGTTASNTGSTQASGGGSGGGAGGQNPANLNNTGSGSATTGGSQIQDNGTLVAMASSPSEPQSQSFAAAPVSVGSNVDDSGIASSTTSDQVAIAPDTSVTSQAPDSSLTAQAGGALSVGAKTAWVLFGILVVILGYILYRRYNNPVRKTPNINNKP